MKPQAATLKKRATKQNKYELGKEPTIRAPYTDWDPNNMTIDAPKEMKSADGSVSFHLGAIMHNYLPTDTCKGGKGRLLIEFPSEDGQQCISEYGIKEVMKQLTKEEEAMIKDGKDVQRVGSGKFKTYCKLSCTSPHANALRKILNDIFQKCIKYLYDYGSDDGCMGIFTKSYPLPKGEVYDHNTKQDNLRHPVWYQEKQTITNGRIVKSYDTDLPSSIPLVVKDKGRGASKFCDDELTPISIDELKNRGIQHIPVAHVECVSTAGPKAAIKLILLSSIVTDKLAEAQVNQSETIAERKAKGISTAQLIREKAALAMSKDDMDGSEDEAVKEKEDAERLAKEKEDAERLAKEKEDAEQTNSSKNRKPSAKSLPKDLSDDEDDIPPPKGSTRR